MQLKWKQNWGREKLLIDIERITTIKQKTAVWMTSSFSSAKATAAFVALASVLYFWKAIGKSGLINVNC